MVRELFQMARTKKACIIFFDELEELDLMTGLVETTKSRERCFRSLLSWMDSMLEETSRF